MKTPDEIKKGLDECTRLGGCAACPYFDRGIAARCTPVLAADALVYIQQLERQNAEQAARLEQVTRERDALMEETSGYCSSCVFLDDCAKHDDGSSYDHRWYFGDCEDWEWRGVPQEAEHDV